ncbi:MAG: acetolactate synthase large subunit [Gemmatimonadaceae bacterium]
MCRRGFVRTSRSTAELSSRCRRRGSSNQGAAGARSATLILPADVSWGEEGVPATPREPAPPPRADARVVDAIVQVLRSGGNNVLLLGGAALREPALMAAARIAAATGCKLWLRCFPLRMARGAGVPPVERLAYMAELASVQLKAFDNLILVGAKAPVSFFAYPGKRSTLVPDSCNVHTLAGGDLDILGSLERLSQAVGAQDREPTRQAPSRPARPRGKRLTADSVCQAVGHLLPERAILIDEAITSGLTLGRFTAGAPRHDLITLTGGAIGQGLPNAVGAAIACPDRPVVALIGDGTSMYTIQALWTMARERLHVITVIFNNAAYSILNVEFARVGADQAGPKAQRQLDLDGPVLNFAQLGQGMGVPSVRANSNAEFLAALEHALGAPGPHLIEAVVPPTLSGLKLRVFRHVLGSLERMPQPVAHALKRAVAG